MGLPPRRCMGGSGQGICVGAGPILVQQNAGAHSEFKHMCLWEYPKRHLCCLYHDVALAVPSLAFPSSWLGPFRCTLPVPYPRHSGMIIKIKSLPMPEAASMIEALLKETLRAVEMVP